jgi:hypothetical protein
VAKREGYLKSGNPTVGETVGYSKFGNPLYDYHGHCALHGKQVVAKIDMLEFLRGQRVPCEEDMTKFTFFLLVGKFHPKEKEFHVDALFAPHVHTKIWLPSYQPQGN